FFHQRTRMRQLFPQHHGTQVRKKLKFAAQPQQRGPLRPSIFFNRRVALRQTNRPKQNYIRLFAHLNRLVRHRIPSPVPPSPATPPRPRVISSPTPTSRHRPPKPLPPPQLPPAQIPREAAAATLNVSKFISGPENTYMYF